MRNEKLDRLIIGYYSGGDDAACLVVARKHGRGLEIINEFRGMEAENLYDKLSNKDSDLDQHREMIYCRMSKHHELLDLYQNDACFKASINAAVQICASWEEALIFAITTGYRYKQDLFEQNVELTKNRAVKILIKNNDSEPSAERQARMNCHEGSGVDGWDCYLDCAFWQGGRCTKNDEED